MLYKKDPMPFRQKMFILKIWLIFFVGVIFAFLSCLFIPAVMQPVIFAAGYIPAALTYAAYSFLKLLKGEDGMRQLFKD